mmetsp:Transcript_33350/g.106320  ORF Transcript_33350/g.106320 Transcript_33350/m.106320 type:complete len:516 (-) Transcript_33350:48-1595(-)
MTMIQQAIRARWSHWLATCDKADVSQHSRALSSPNRLSNTLIGEPSVCVTQHLSHRLVCEGEVVSQSGFHVAMNLLGHVLEVRGNIVTMWVNGLCEHFEPLDQGLANEQQQHLHEVLEATGGFRHVVSEPIKHKGHVVNISVNRVRIFRGGHALEVDCSDDRDLSLLLFAWVAQVPQKLLNLAEGRGVEHPLICTRACALCTGPHARHARHQWDGVPDHAARLGVSSLVEGRRKFQAHAESPALGGYLAPVQVHVALVGLEELFAGHEAVALSDRITLQSADVTLHLVLHRRPLRGREAWGCGRGGRGIGRVSSAARVCRTRESDASAGGCKAACHSRQGRGARGSRLRRLGQPGQPIDVHSLGLAAAIERHRELDGLADVPRLRHEVLVDEDIDAPSFLGLLAIDEAKSVLVVVALEAAHVVGDALAVGRHEVLAQHHLVGVGQPGDDVALVCVLGRRQAGAAVAARHERRRVRVEIGTVGLRDHRGFCGLRDRRRSWRRRLVPGRCHGRRCRR